MRNGVCVFSSCHPLWLGSKDHSEIWARHYHKIVFWARTSGKSREDDRHSTDTTAPGFAIHEELRKRRVDQALETPRPLVRYLIRSRALKNKAKVYCRQRIVNQPICRVLERVVMSLHRLKRYFRRGMKKFEIELSVLLWDDTFVEDLGCLVSKHTCLTCSPFQNGPGVSRAETGAVWNSGKVHYCFSV